MIRKYDLSLEKIRTLLICFGNMILSFESMKISKKVEYLLRNYDVFVQQNDFSKKINYLLRKYDFVDQSYDSGRQDPAIQEPLPAKAWAPFAQTY